MRAGGNSDKRFFEERVFPKLLGEEKYGEAIMAFTDVEVKEAEARLLQVLNRKTFSALV